MKYIGGIIFTIFLVCNFQVSEASLPIVGYEITGDQVTYDNYRKPLVGVDLGSFEIINLEYAKDKNHVFYCGEILKEIDSKSFRWLSDRYIQDHKGVYFNGKLMPEVDASSFIVLQDKKYPFVYQFAYAKDKNWIFFEDKIHPVDQGSFEVLQEGYTKDKNHVYFYNQIRPEFDALTFEQIGFYPIQHNKIFSIDDIRFSNYHRNVYLKDKKGVYFYQEVNPKVPPEAGAKMIGADGKTFQVILESEGFFVKDQNQVYYLGMVIPNADPVTFEVLDFGIRSEMKYSRDKNFIFEGTKKLAKASEEAIGKLRSKLKSEESSQSN